MKKGFALLLAASLVISMFSSAALAAETTQEKYDALVEKGIFDGFPDGTSRLEDPMTRAQAAKVITLVLGLEENAAAASVYTDLADALWATGFIGAATEAGILNGRGNGIFDPNTNVSIQELAKIVVEALGIETDDSAVVAGADEWAMKYVAAALAAGLLPQMASYTEPAMRGLLVEASYAADMAIIDLEVEATVNANNSVTVAGTTELSEVAIEVGETTETVAVADGAFTFTTGVLSAGTHQITVSGTGDHSGVTNSVEVTIEAPDFSASVIGVKKIEVQFGQEVDTSAVAVSVTKANIAVNVQSTTFADNKQSAVLNFANNLPAGEYVVSVVGVADEALTATVTVAAEEVASIEFNSTTALITRADDKKVKFGYTIKNQYGESITKDLTITASKGAGEQASGEITLTASSAYTVGEKVVVGLLQTDSSKFVSATLDVVAAPQVTTAGIAKLHEADGSELTAGSTKTFYLVLDLKDQYGNSVTDATYAPQDVIITVSNPAAATLQGYADNTANFSTQTIDGGTKLVLTLANGGALTAGTSKVTIVSKYTGSMATFDLVVKANPIVDTLTLSVPTLAPAGEEVEIPFTAVDQFGNAVKHPDFDLNVTGAGNDIEFVKDIVKDETKLILTLADAASGTVIISGLTPNNKFVQLSVSVAALAKPTVITGVSGISPLLVGATKQVSASNVVIKDQYGRNISIADPIDGATYNVKIASVGGSAVTAGDDELPATFTAAAKGTSAVTLSLTKTVGTPDVANSAFTFSYSVVSKADITDYEASVAGVVYDDGGDDYGKALSVNGVLADGSKVAIPYASGANYQVVVPASSSALIYDTVTGNVYSDGDFFDNATSDGEGTLIVTIIADGGATQVKTVPVQVSSKVPAITTLSVVAATGLTTLIDTNYISTSLSNLSDFAELQDLIIETVKAQDQYGIEWDAPDEAYPNVIITGTSKTIDGYNGAMATTLAATDTFNVLVLTANGKSISFKVFVTAAIIT